MVAFYYSKPTLRYIAIFRSFKIAGNYTVRFFIFFIFAIRLNCLKGMEGIHCFSIHYSVELAGTLLHYLTGSFDKQASASQGDEKSIEKIQGLLSK